MLQPGDKAPDFTLRASDKAQVHLKDFQGKNVVLLFFPAAFTSVCTKELCMMRDSLHEYEGLNAQILAISVDSLYALARWKKDENFNFPLLSDFNKTVSKKYHAFYKDFVFEMKGVAKRAAFVIDKNGVVQYSEQTPTPKDLPNFNAVKEVLAKLG